MSGKRIKLPNSEGPPKTRSKAAEERATVRNNALRLSGRQRPENTAPLAITARIFRDDEVPGAVWMYETKGPKRRTRFMAAAAAAEDVKQDAPRGDAVFKRPYTYSIT